MNTNVKAQISMLWALIGIMATGKMDLMHMKQLFRKSLFISILLIICLYVPCFVIAAPLEQVSLTEDEKAWLKAHPDIVLGYTGAFEPEVIVNLDGTFRGILVDFLDELNRRLGTRIRLEIEPVPELLEKAKKKEIDGILSLHPEYADKLGLLKTDSYQTNYAAVFSRKEVSFDRPADLSEKKVAVVDKVFFSEQIIEQYGAGATVLKVLNAEEGLRLVNKGKADYFIAASSNAYLIIKYQLFDLVTQHVFYDHPIDSVIGTRSDWPELVSILNKGLSHFSKEDMETIYAKWSRLLAEEKTIALTPAEQTWLEENHTIRVRVTDSAPYLYSEKGQAVGIAVDLLKVISESTGIKFHFVIHSPPFAEDLKGLIQHAGPDIIATLMPDPEREKNILFTGIYVSSPWFIFTRDNAPFVSSMNDLNGRTVAVVKDYLVHEDLAKNYPDIELLIFENNKEALLAVSSGKAFAFIGDLMSTPAMINKFGLNNLKAVSPSSLQEHKTAMGIRSDWPELRNIINKVLDSMAAAKKTAIINKWASVKFDYGISPTDVKKWVLIFGCILAIILFFIISWNRSLTRRVKERTSTLAESEERFRSTFEQAAVGISHVSHEGRFLRINQKFCEIVGYTHDEVLGLTFQEITYSEDLNTDLDYVNQLLSGDINTYSMEKRYIRKNGELVWVHLTVSLVRNEMNQSQWFVSVIKEITERKRAENALKESEEQLRNMIDQSPVSILIMTPDGRVSQINPAYIKLWDITEKTLLEVYEKYNLLKDEQIRKMGIMPLVEKAFNGESVILPPIKYIATDTMETLGFINISGRDRWIQCRLYPVKNREGEIKNVVMLVEDITEIKNSEQEMRQLRDEYTHIARVSAMGELTASLAHELKQPLAAIRSNAQAAQRFLTWDKPDIDELHEILKDIIKDNRRADDVIGKLRALMRKGELQIAELNINDAINEFIPIVKSYELVRDVSLKLELNENISLVGGDRIQLQQVVLNLILNSTEALTNANIKLRTIVVRTNQEDAQDVTVSITDNGPGIDEKAMSHLFEPFYTTKEEGLGMGLAICRSIIEEHGGRLWVENSPEAGATFYFTIPVSKGGSA